ncbi:hypothetical protein C5167_009690 [Papaver somniferum]|uniref:RNA polymerase II C-terminal domain phosphatase-like n=1 Tax=Papaver somniferum TaxID=3469 RepID=A0A4Y7K215_PAPSO|nr:hypothetical protein C5167_009690 [Papaver somniferum]
MCVKCGRMVDNASAVALGYIHQYLIVDSDELARLRDKDLKSLLGKKKLYLVLDLDHTLLNSTHFHHISPDEEYLKSQIDSLHDLPNGNLFKLDSMRMFTKLRPFVRTFLKEASNMFEMYVYTMGERPYAMEMARLLDPGKIYFDSRVISQADCTQKHQKGLDVVLGAESAVIILDDMEYVWGQHKENLILVDRYHYFASSGRSFNLNNRSISELKRDESEPDGALATILEVLKLIHHLFFDLERGDDIMRRDVRQVLKTVRSEVLRGCKLFSGLYGMICARIPTHPPGRPKFVGVGFRGDFEKVLNLVRIFLSYLGLFLNHTGNNNIFIIAQEYLYEKDISLVLTIKRPLLERIARCTGAQIVPSIDHLSSQNPGYCEAIKVEKFFEEHGSAG